MSSDLLRQAAEVMRREDAPFFDAVAALLERSAAELAECERFDRPEVHRRRLAPGGAYADVLTIAKAYLADPGELPEDAEPAGAA